MCDRVVSENLFLILYCPDKYITQKMCDEPVDDSLATLQLIRNWFLASKIIKKLFSTLYADQNILYFDKNSSNVV